MTFDPLRALRALVDHGVAFVVVGGFAGQVHGAPLTTQDIDVCYERSPANLDRLAAALRTLGARLRVAGVDEELPFVLDARSLAAGDSFTFATDVGDLDVLATPAGTRGFADLDARAVAYDLGDGLVIRVAAIADLMRMKRAAGRAKDRVHLELLQALQDVLDGRDASP